MSSVKARLDQYLAEMLAPAHANEQGVWLQTRMPAMIRETGLADEFVWRIATDAVTTGQSEPPEHSLFAAVLDEARRAEEDERGEGQRFLAAVHAAIAELDPAQVRPEGRRALARLHARAALPVPESLIAAPSTEPFDDDNLPLPEDVEAGLMGQLEKFLYECDGDLYELHGMLVEVLAGMPTEGANDLIQHLAANDDPRWQRLSTYWLLDRDSAVRMAVASGWLERARAGKLDALVAARMPLLRSWLPDEAARRAVDEALATTRRQQISTEPFPDVSEWEDALVSLPDGAGAQYIAVAVPAGQARRTWAMVLTKSGHGVRDAYLLTELEQSEEDEIFDRLRQAMDTVNASRETVECLLAGAVAENVSAGVPPAHGLIDVVATLGFGSLRPQTLTVAGLRHRLDPDGELASLSPQMRGRLINSSADWTKELLTLDSWFEQSVAVDNILEATLGRPRIRERELRAHLENRREWWASLCLHSALVLRDEPERGLFSSLLATGAALLDGRELKKIPIMEQVLTLTIDAWEQRSIDDEDPQESLGIDAGDGTGFNPLIDTNAIAGFSEAQQATLQSFFNDGPGARVWPAGWFGVNGYLFGIATHPHMVPPSEWLPVLISDDEDAGAKLSIDQDELTTVLDALLALYNAINDQVLNRKPTLPPGCVAREPAEANFWPDGPLGQWSWGFREVRRRFDHQLEMILASVDESDPEGAAVIAQGEYATFTLEALSDSQLLGTVIKMDQSSGRKPTLAAAAADIAADIPECIQLVVATALMMREAARPADTGEFSPPPHATPQPPVRRQKVGRNAQCPCGSGRKYKRCCGAP